MKSEVLIRPETDGDRHAVWTVNRIAFESDSEPTLVDALRDSGFAAVSLVAEIESEVVGHILFGPLTIITETAKINAASLAPMAVLPNHQRQGIGSKLVEAGLAACREQGYRIAVVLGHSKFYPRFGFKADLAGPLQNPFGNGEAWMAMELVPGALKGIKGRVEYPAPFNALE